MTPAPLGAPPPGGATQVGALEVRLRKRHPAGRAPGWRWGRARGRALTPVTGFHLDATFAADPGVTVIVGHSGAGKTTVLRCIAGLSEPDDGRIAVGDRLLFDSTRGVRLEPSRRRVAIVFQDLALFPHLSVESNVTYGLRRLDPAERRRRTGEILESFQIGHLGGRAPREISGGEQQRVALARALVTEPAVLLLDEPLSSLDPVTKLRIIEDLQRWNRSRRIPILYVTHDEGEVLALGDRVIALEQGRIVSQGLPIELVTAPPRAALAGPAGFDNLFDATVVGRRDEDGSLLCRLTGTSIEFRVPPAPVAVGSEVCVGLRAGEILLSTARPALVSDCNLIAGTVRTLAPPNREAGSAVEARVTGGAEFRVRMPAAAAEAHGLGPSSEVWMLIAAPACHLVRPDLLDALRRLFVFVCHGNTLRSPLAQAICNAEIAARLGVPAGALAGLGVGAVSAGLSARPGAPLEEGVAAALRALDLPLPDHRARNLTRRLAGRAEAVFCMDEAQRRELAAAFPDAAARAFRLDPDADLEDPHGDAGPGLVDLGRRMREAIRRRLDGLGIVGPAGVSTAP